MAKSITGCDWAYEVIEGMDTWIDTNFPDVRRNNHPRKSAFGARSGYNNDGTPKKISDSFEHLSPAAALQYQAFAQDDGYKLHARCHNNAEENRRAEALAPRPKVVVLDLAWDLTHDLMPRKITFLTKQCRVINTKRCRDWPGPNGENRNFLKEIVPEADGSTHLHHGAACVGALRISNQSDDKEIEDRHLHLIWGHEKHKNEAALWNLSSRADIILLPLREHAPITLDAYQRCLRIAFEAATKDEVFLNRGEYETYSDPRFVDWINQASAADPFKNIEHFKDELCEILNPTLGQQTEEIVNKLINLIYSALEEAGYAATLDVLKCASQEGQKVGCGDTLVVPMQVDWWSKTAHENRKTFRNKAFSGEKFLLGRSGPDACNLVLPKPQDVDHIELPIIVFPEVEQRVQSLTCDHKLSVIISGGNSHIDLGLLDMEAIDGILPTPRLRPAYEDEDGNEDKAAKEAHLSEISQQLFKTRGCRCGAVIVGSGIVRLADFWMDPFSERFINKDKKKIKKVEKHARKLKLSLLPPSSPEATEDNPNNWVDPDDHRRNFANFGLCIDAFGRGSANDIAELKEEAKRLQTEMAVSAEVYAQWNGASIASMATAACLANVQQIRLLWDFIAHLEYSMAVQAAQEGDDAPHKPDYIGPLKPYEARAHFQQWRSNNSYYYRCVEDLMGAPPDIRGWFEGTCVMNRLEEYAVEGQEIIRQHRESLA